MGSHQKKIDVSPNFPQTDHRVRKLLIGFVEFPDLFKKIVEFYLNSSIILLPRGNKLPQHIVHFNKVMW
jgi:hypothetical protein